MTQGAKRAQEAELHVDCLQGGDAGNPFSIASFDLSAAEAAIRQWSALQKRHGSFKARDAIIAEYDRLAVAVASAQEKEAHS